MGTAACAAVALDPDLELVAAVGRGSAGQTVHGVTVAAEPRALVEARCEVVVDFTTAPAARITVPWLAMHGIHAVVGTTGFDDSDLDAFRHAFTGSNCLVASNFAISAVLMMRFAEMAAPFFETAEIIELHHDNKIDAPSGTAMTTARRMTAASEQWGTDPTTTVVADGARGGLVGDAIRVHSVRMRGVIASQEVLLGTTGQTLSIRHDTFDRSSFMPGVLLGVRRVAALADGLTLGLDALLDA
jgi:4-hydroxy-tetrahydrodipicolinate reductase